MTRQGFPGGSVVKSSPANAGDSGDTGLILRSGRSPGVGNGSLLQYSCLKNLMNRGAWQATVYGVAKSQTQLCDWARACTHTHTHTRWYARVDGNGEEDNKGDETPDIGGSQELAKDTISFLFTSNVSTRSQELRISLVTTLVFTSRKSTALGTKENQNN